MNRKSGLAVICLSIFITVSVTSAFIAAGRHLHHMGDEHDHALNCPLRAFLDLCYVSLPFAAVILASALARRLKLKLVNVYCFCAELIRPFSRAPPEFP